MREKTLEETYDKCIAEGSIIPLLKIDHEKIRFLLKKSLEDLESIKEASKSKKLSYDFLLKAHYETMHFLASCVLLLDKVKSLNHECLFAYLCTKHPELDSDWGFFQKIRTKRNGITYYFESITKEEWTQLELQFTVYIKTLENHIKSKLEIL